MQDQADRGWVRAGLAVLVTGVLGGGVLAVASGTDDRHQLTADGVATGRPASAAPLEGPGPERAPEPRESDPTVGDKVPMGDDGGSVTVSDVEDNVSAGRLFGAGEGFKYVAAEVKGCSGPNEKNITFEPAYFLLRLDDGTIRDPGPGAKKPSLEGGTVPAGKCLSGWVTFTVPEGALPTGVIYDGSVRTTWTVPLPKNAQPTTTTTLKAGATTSTTAGKGSTTTSTARSSASTTTTKPKSASAGGTSTTTSTAKGGSTTASTGKGGTGSTTTSTAKGGAGTTTTAKPGSSTSTTGKSASTTTTAPAKPATSTTTRPATTPPPAEG